MGMKSSVAIDSDMRKKLKKMAAILDKSQKDIITEALQDYEIKIGFKFRNDLNSTEPEKNDIDIEKILKHATEVVWKNNPKKKKRQMRLFSGSDTIDEIITQSWDSGLNYE
jgi:hypothetical protein